MKLLIGFAAGIATAWAALAIWQRVPPLGPVDVADEWPPAPRTDPRVHRRADGGAL